MAIRIVRNEAGNCINFYGASNPTYWNACLSGEVDSTDDTLVNVVNDIITAETGKKQYEFFRIPFTEFTNKDGNSFSDAQEAADYITVNANVVGLGGGGTDLTDIDVCFKLDDTSTSIMLDNGFSYGVNTIKAVDTGDGLITIKSQLGDIVHFTKLDHTNVCDGNGVSINGGLNDVINYLNELFTVGPFESIVIADPHSTMIADVSGVTAGYTLEGSTAIDPVGDDIFTNSSSGSLAGLKSTATIDQAGEYFTFDIRGEGQIGFGLVHTTDSYNDGYYTGSATYANPATFATSNNAHYGFQFSHWFHPTPNGSWTNYGANTSYSMRPGWSNFNGTDEQADWLAGNPIKVRVGLDINGFISIETLRNGTDWVVHARTSYPVAQGSEFHLGIKAANSSPRVFSEPKVHLLEPAAPVMNFRYIESPDGVFNYPLFATEEEANYYDEQNGGSGTSHTHTYVDDPTNTTWYMPDTNSTMSGTSAPAGDLTLGQYATYTEITSLTNSDLAPPVFSATDITQEEGTNVNIQVTPAGANWSSSVSISPSGSGLVYDGTSIVQGTLADVGSDTTYTITVTRGNSYGSTTGQMTVTATDVAPVQTNDTPWSKALDFNGSSERAQPVSSSYANTPLKMAGTNNQVTAPTTSGNTVASGHPWATAIVFNSDKNSSNQHIWNLGEGAGTTDDNIYLRTDATGKLYFGWGRQGDLCEMLIRPNGTGTGWTLTAGNWYGIYIAHNGTRYGSNNTTSLTADAFDIRLMGSSNNWATVNGSDTNLSVASDWSITGDGRMNRQYQGDFTIGGRGANRNFHGKVASMVVTTLKCNVAMPTTTEIELMIKDPIKWIQDYKEGNTFRQPLHTTTNTDWDTSVGTTKAFATQVWLMGDGTSDSYSNMIRNQVFPSDQNYTKLNMISMVSNDIETVNINGLT